MNTIIDTAKDLNTTVVALSTLTTTHKTAGSVGASSKRNVLRRVALLEEIALALPEALLATYFRNLARGENAIHLATEETMAVVYDLPEFQYSARLTAALLDSRKALN